MLTPTHVQVAVLHTRNLVVKGKGANDVFIIYSLGKQKFQSSVKEKVSQSVLEWNEGCDIAIPSSQSNKSELVLKVLHKGSITEKFLGRVALPLSEFDVTAKPKPKWYPLKPKPGKEKDTKPRGDIEVKISFLIKTEANESTSDLSSKSKRKDSFKSSLGSILSLGGGKNKKKKEKGNKDSSSSKDSLSNSGSADSLRNSSTKTSRLNLNNNLPIINDDPGVISEEEEEDDEQFHSKSQAIKSKQSRSKTSIVSGSMSERIHSASVPSTPKSRAGFRGIFHTSSTSIDDDFDDVVPVAVPKPRTVRLPSVIVEEPPAITVTAPSTPQPASKPSQKLPVSASMSNLMDASDGKRSMRKSIKSMFAPSKHMSVDEIFHPQSQDGHSKHETMKRSPSIRDLKIPKETFKQYERKSKEELIAMIMSLQGTVSTQERKITDLQDYIDKLLLRVLDNMPALLKKGNSFRAS